MFGLHYSISWVIVLSVIVLFGMTGCGYVRVQLNPEKQKIANLSHTYFSHEDEEGDYEIMDDAGGHGRGHGHGRGQAVGEDEVAAEADVADMSMPVQGVPEASDAQILAGLSAPVYFALDDYQLGDEQVRRLRRLGDFMQRADHKSKQLHIEGHCDDRGTRDYNFALGDKRAHKIAEVLIATGVHPARITTISYGKERPLCWGSLVKRGLKIGEDGS